MQTPAADEDEEKRLQKAARPKEAEGGEGIVELDLGATAQAEGIFVLIGARPGVEGGTYRMVGLPTRRIAAEVRERLGLKQPTRSADKGHREPGEDGNGSGTRDGAANSWAGSIGSAASSSERFVDYNLRYSQR